MKKIFTLATFCLALGVTVSAQTKAVKSSVSNPVKWDKKALLAQETTPNVANPSPLTNSGVNYRDPEVAIFSDNYWDAQSYGCMPSRVYTNAAGRHVATWLYGVTAPGYADRGTGYSVDNATGWTPPTGRVEAVRTGFPAAAIMGDGTELIVAHNTSAGLPYKINLAKKAAGATAWTELSLPLPPNNSGGLLWPRVAVGGSDKMTIHVIAITTPVGNMGVTYNGVDAQVLYYRSKDGGNTWDKQFEIIPGLDGSKFLKTDADSYTIDAFEDAVAVAVFPTWNDVTLFKSLDNGDSWDKTTVYDFPDAIEDYTALAGEYYEVTDIPVDADAPDSLSVFTNDGFGSLLIDAGLQAHIWFGRMYVVDNDTSAGSFYFPGTNGLVYWREQDGTDNFSYLTGALDYNNDTTLNINGSGAIGPYYNSLSSFPTSGVDQDGNIYLAYSAIHESYTSAGAEKDQVYRHLYIMRSGDGGETWTDPLDLTNAPYLDEFLVPYTEAVYPSIQRNIDNKIYLVYQQDATPGTSVWGANHAAGPNAIVSLTVEKMDLDPLIGTSLPNGKLMELAVSPNPVENLLTATFEVTGNNGATIQLFDMLGNLIQSSSVKGNGMQNITLPTHHLAAGTYCLKVSEHARTGVVKVIKF